MRNANLFALVLLISSLSVSAQEVKFINLVGLTQRTELRHPPAPPSNCEAGKPCVGGWGSVGIGDGAADRRDPHALGVDLVYVSLAEINGDEPFEAEFRVVNTGLAPIELPVSPHLSDLQPSDESLEFSYYSISLLAQAHTDSHSWLPYQGSIELYGSPDHDDTMLTLKPGQWIRVRANMKLRSWPSKPLSAELAGTFSLRTNTFLPHPGGDSVQIDNLYPNATPTPPIPVHLLPAPASASKRQ